MAVRMDVWERGGVEIEGVEEERQRVPGGSVARISNDE